MDKPRDFEPAQPKFVTSWSGSERTWKKSRSADCRGPGPALRRDPTEVPRPPERPIAIKMGKIVDSWILSTNSFKGLGRVVGCFLEDAAVDMLNNNGLVDDLIKFYSHKRTDVFYMLQFSEERFRVHPEADIKLISEDYAERRAVSQHPGLPGNFLTEYQHRLSLQTSDGLPAKLGCRVTTKKLGLPITATLVGMIAKDSAATPTRQNTDSERWDRLYPDWRNDDVCVLRIDGGQRFMSYKEYLELATDILTSQESENELGEVAEQVKEFGIEAFDDQLRKQYETMGDDEYRYTQVPVADVEILH